MGSPIVLGQDIAISDGDWANELKTTLMLLWNSYKYFASYASLDKWETTIEYEAEPSSLDRWILNRLDQTVLEMDKNLSEYQIPKAVTWMKEFVDDLSTWYIRRSRDRVGPSAVDLKDKQMAYTTMNTVFSIFLKAIAPLTPFISEFLYRHLTGEESVHLVDWPEVTTESVIDQKLLENMNLVRKVSEMGNAERKRLAIPIKQPLLSILVSGEFESLADQDDLVQLIKEELNVENVKFEKAQIQKVEYDTTITDHLKEKGLAREMVRAIQEARKAAGCRLDEKIDLILPDWPTKFVDDIKRKTLVNNLQKGSELQVIRYENNEAE